MVQFSYRSKNTLTILVALLALTGLVAACTGELKKDQSLPTLTVTAENTPLPTSTAQPPTPPPPTVTPSPSATTEITDDAEIANAGLFLLAMNDGNFNHLFAYHPIYFPLTRLTTGDYDYADPAVSPDGSEIAYCANPNGKWEIYTLDLLNGLQVQVSQTGSYACSPTWSPDGLWLAYETLSNGKLIILLQSTVDLTQPPLNLTKPSTNSFDPAWSPGGREIAYVTDRSGRLEIWQADLNAVENRMSPLLTSSEANYSSPDWSMDGQSLVWIKTTDHSVIESRSFAEDEQETILLGSGTKPVWALNSLGVTALLRTPNGYELVSYHDDPTHLLFPAIHLPGGVTALTWRSGSIVTNVKSYLASYSLADPASLFDEEETSPDVVSGLFSRVYIDDLQAPEAYLADTVNDRFTSMREELKSELGWDFLGILQDAAISLPADSEIDIRGKWLYTGRAISVNLDPLDAGWMLVSREDFTGQTYWRVWLKCINQDGSCGTPLKEPVWDFSARSNGEMAGYENGGDTGTIPESYWFDFTAFALRYGWERIPADSNWRNYFPATNISIFTLKDGLTWQQAMRQVYTDEELAEVFH